MKARPKATPTSPKALARCSGGVMSARTAVAVAAVPPLSPSMKRARNSKARGTPAARAWGQSWAQGKIKVAANRESPNTEPATQTVITGLRPKRSLRAPIKGVPANWARA
jgi:hypothetical protein